MSGWPGCRVVVAAPRRPSTCWWICSSATTGDRDQVSEQLISRYERYIACARQPALREVQRRILQQRTDAVVKVVERCGRSVRAELVPALVCAVDGAVVAALVDDGDGPRSAARATLIDVIDVLAPITAPISAPLLTAASRLIPVTVSSLFAPLRVQCGWCWSMMGYSQPTDREAPMSRGRYRRKAARTEAGDGPGTAVVVRRR